MEANKKINLLIISGYYPPTISIASNRILAISKYLDIEKFDITVLTYGDKSDYPSPKGVKVIRINDHSFFRPLTFEKSRPFVIHKAKALYNTILKYLVKDEWQGWRGTALKQVLNNYKKNHFDFVISSFAPAAAHKLALQMKQNGYSFKWIADMRDEMSMNLIHSLKERNSFRKIEELIFKKAIAITSTAQQANENFKKLGSNHPIDCFEVKNGYDFIISEEQYSNEVFTISHVGTFYGKRKPTLFLQALEKLIHSGDIEDVRVRFVGIATPLSIPSVLNNKVETSQKISHAKAVEIMKKSDANLLIISPEQKGAIPGKIYEYMGSLKPIIGVFYQEKNLQTAEILQKSGLAYLSDFDDIESVKRNILLIYKNWKAKEKPTYHMDYIQQFHRKAQVKILERYILNKNDG